MELDDELCLCFHVTRREIENYIQRTKPQRPSQLSECFGAGTGCGWCRPFLYRLWQRAQPSAESSDRDAIESTTPNDYARQRTEYRQKQDEN